MFTCVFIINLFIYFTNNLNIYHHLLRSLRKTIEVFEGGSKGKKYNIHTIENCHPHWKWYYL